MRSNVTIPAAELLRQIFNELIHSKFISIEDKKRLRITISDALLDFNYASGNHKMISLRLMPFMTSKHMSETIQNINTEGDELESFKLNSQRLGSKVLTNANFEQRHKKIVDSSFNKALTNGEKLYGGNSERRNYSYLSRINNLVERYGNRAEKKIWDSASRKLIIDDEDIPDSYWRAQEQILRDNGQGIELDDYEKGLLTDNIKKTQEESLKSWSDYLGAEESPYPIWFKIYAWDGMSKMGVFDKNKKRFDNTSCS